MASAACLVPRRLRYGSSPRKVKVVTLKGAVIAKNGNMTGGTASYEDSASHWEQKDLEEVSTVPARGMPTCCRRRA